MRMREAGLISKWTKEYQPKPQQCLVKDKPKLKKLKLDSYTGTFIVLACGVILSLIVFIFETFYLHAFLIPKIF